MKKNTITLVITFILFTLIGQLLSYARETHYSDVYNLIAHSVDFENQSGYKAQLTIEALTPEGKNPQKIPSNWLETGKNQPLKSDNYFGRYQSRYKIAVDLPSGRQEADLKFVWPVQPIGDHYSQPLVFAGTKFDLDIKFDEDIVIMILLKAN